ALDHREVHAADDVTAALAQRRERAVAQHDLALGAGRGLEAARPERTGCGTQWRRLRRRAGQPATDPLAVLARRAAQRLARIIRSAVGDGAAQHLRGPLVAPLRQRHVELEGGAPVELARPARAGPAAAAQAPERGPRSGA